MAFQKLPEQEFKDMSGTVAILVADFHKDVCDGLLAGVEEVFEQHPQLKWHIERLPGAFEIPLMAQRMASLVHEESEEKVFDVILALGCVVKGDTYHFELVANECARGCMDVMLSTGTPVVFEVLAPYNKEQALERSMGENNHGRYAAQVALNWLQSIR